MATDVVLRRVRSTDDLAEVYLAIGRQFVPPFAGDDRRLADVMPHFPRDRGLMLAVESNGLRGGIIAVASGSAVGVKAVGIDESLRGLGVGRALLEAVEVQALTIGAVNIVLGAAERARGFYEHLGFRGKHAMREKQLPLPGPVRDLLTSRRLAGLGDLEAGVIIARLPATPSAPSGRVETAGS